MRTAVAPQALLDKGQQPCRQPCTLHPGPNSEVGTNDKPKCMSSELFFVKTAVCEKGYAVHHDTILILSVLH